MTFRSDSCTAARSSSDAAIAVCRTFSVAVNSSRSDASSGLAVKSGTGAFVLELGAEP